MSLANIASLAYQPESIRVRGIPVYTNTPPAHRPTGPRRGAGDRHAGAADGQGGATAGDRPHGDDPYQRAGRAGEVRRARTGWQPEQCLECLRARGARQGDGGVQLVGADPSERSAERQQADRHRGCAQHVLGRQFRHGRSHGAPTRRASPESTPVSATWARNRSPTPPARPPKRSTCRGIRWSWSGVRRIATYRGVRCRSAARRPTPKRGPTGQPVSTPSASCRRSQHTIWAGHPTTTTSPASGCSNGVTGRRG